MNRTCLIAALLGLVVSACPEEAAPDTVETCLSGAERTVCTPGPAECRADQLDVCVSDLDGCTSLLTLPCGMALAPPSFDLADDRLVHVDIRAVDASIRLDASTQTAHIVASVDFALPHSGRPLIALDVAADQITAVAVNGVDVPPSYFVPTVPPYPTSSTDEGPQLNALTETLSPGAYGLQLTYTLPTSDVVFGRNGPLFTDFGDSPYPGGSRRVRYLEQLLPSNAEFDTFAVTLDVAVDGTTKTHVVTSNAREVDALGGNRWLLRFPEWYSASSHYLHVFEADLNARIDMTLQGSGGVIPVTLYGPWVESLNAFWELLEQAFVDVESRYGPYPHDALILFHNPFPGSAGGMEHSGAFWIAEAYALVHELTHCWFGRSVLSAGGDAGWIDEAIAGLTDPWHDTPEDVADEGWYPLTDISPHSWETPFGASRFGRSWLKLMEPELPLPEGLSPVLRSFAETFRRQPVNTSMFKAFLETTTGVDLTPWFALIGTTRPGP